MALMIKDRDVREAVAGEAVATLAALRDALATDGIHLDARWIDGTDFDAVASYDGVEIARVTLNSGRTHRQVDVHPPEPGAFALIGHWPRIPRGDAGAAAGVVAEVRDLFRAALVASGAMDARDFPTTESAVGFCRELSATAPASPSARALAKAARAVAGGKGAPDREAALEVLHACADTVPDAASERMEPGFAAATRRARTLTRSVPDRLETAWRRNSHLGWLSEPPATPGP